MPAVSVLVIEDDQINRDALVRLIRFSGMDVNSAGTVGDALDKLTHRPNRVLLDIQLPDGSGAELLHWIRREKLPTRVAVITGRLDEDTLARLNDMKPDTIFYKPVQPDDVLHWLSHPGSHRGGSRAAVE